MAAVEVFTLAEIRDLARNPSLDLGARRAQNRARGGGFSYPQQRWLYDACASFYAGERNPKILRETFDAALARGRGLTPWKRSVARSMGTILDAVVELDRTARGEFERSAFVFPLATTIWRGHGLRVPLGLMICDGEDRLLRMLWMDERLQARGKGITLVAAATLAASEALGPIAAVETWHLRDRERRIFHAHDLRHSLDRLDQILATARGRLDTPPAVA